MATALPSIDLEPFIAGSGQGRQAVPGPSRRRARRSASSRSIHGLPQTLIDTAFATASDFFGQPQAIKDLSRPPKSASARGYHALLTKNLAKTLGYDNPPDLREQFYIGPLVSRAAEFAHIPGASELYAENIWPQAPAAYRQVFSAYYTALEKLGGR
jgi:isopenicillin N synthase-like dioxygenase